MFWEPCFSRKAGTARHIAIDGKTMRASKDSEGKAEHVLSAFCSSLQTVSDTRPRAADGSANLSRHTFAPSQEERRVAEATARGRLSRLQLARRRLATGVRDHWRIEIMHRNKDVILGEDGYTNCCDNAPRNIFCVACLGFSWAVRFTIASRTSALIDFLPARAPLPLSLSKRSTPPSM